MGHGKDPIERASGESVDLHDVSTWEARSILDRISLYLYRFAIVGFRWALVLTGLLILLSFFVLGGLGAVVQQPLVTVLVALSAIPALLVAVYVWYADVTTGEPLSLLIVTFFLAILFAGFAAIVNDTVGVLVGGGVGFLTGSGFLATTLVFFLVVGPIEEFVKILAVRLYAYRSDRFDAVIDGAVYGAVAGLGFATIENALFIGQSVQQAAADTALLSAGGTAVTRALVGPGHVLYSAIAGYYLGLAKFNPDRAVPIALKGLLVAALFHAFYNTGTTFVPEALSSLIGPIGPFTAIVLYVIGFNTVVGAYLYRKLKRYRDTYHAVGVGDRTRGPVGVAEYDPSTSAPPIRTGRVARRNASSTRTDEGTGDTSPPQWTKRASPIDPPDRQRDDRDLKK